MDESWAVEGVIGVGGEWGVLAYGVVSFCERFEVLAIGDAPHAAVLGWKVR